MTPKEKAKDLLKKMDVIHYMKLSGKNSKGLPISMYNSQIKQCALISVNEIIKELNDYMFNNDIDDKQPIKYFEKVKQELLTL